MPLWITPARNGDDAVGHFVGVWSVFMDQHCHACLRLLDAESKTLQPRILVVEAGKNFLDRAEDSLLIGFIRIATAGACIIAIETVGNAAIEAVE
jgi:hypothetical protein